MLFTSYIFIFLFLPLVYIIFRFSKRYNSSISLGILFISSLIFYSYWNIYNIFVICSSLTINYIIGNGIIIFSFNYIRKVFYSIGILFNLGIIFYYKYFDFFINEVLSYNTGIFDTTSIILTLAISFFTFQQITFLSECYKKQIKSIPILNYLLYITFFKSEIKVLLFQYSIGFLNFKRLLHNLSFRFSRQIIHNWLSNILYKYI